MSMMSQGSTNPNIKRKIQPYKRRSRTKQPRSRTVKYVRGEGPAKGLRLSYDPNDPQFPRKWVLSQGDLILGVYRSEPTAEWEKLTKLHKELNAAEFEGVPAHLQVLRQSMDHEELKRINFWDKVGRQGRKKHSHPNLTIREVSFSGQALTINPGK